MRRLRSDPRLADAAVAVQVDGEVRDLRLPVNDGETIRILTDRDEAGAGRAPSFDRARDGAGGVAPVAGRQDRDRARHRRRLLLRLRVPRSRSRPTTSNGSRRRCARILARAMSRSCGRTAWSERSCSRASGRRTSVQARARRGARRPAISLYRNDDFEDLCRGPHLQTTKPIKAFKLLSTAGAYWRGDSSRPMLTRIYGTAFFRQADLDAYLAQVEEARRRDHRRLGRELDLFHFDPHSPGSPLWHPRGMVIWNALEDLRRNAQRPAWLRRGQDAASLRRRALEDVRTLGEVPRQHVPRPRRGRGPHLRPEAHELPWRTCCSSAAGGAAIASSRSATPRRRPCTETSSTGTLHGLMRVRHVTQDDAPHLLHDGADRGRDLRLPRLHRRALRHLRRRAAA